MYMKLEALKKLLFVGIIIGVLYSCGDKKQSSEAGEADSLMIKYTALMDSVNANWAIMIADDDDKHVLMNRLLLEVSYTNNYDKEKYRELSTKLDQLKAMRYDQQSMRVSATIDAYDSATFDLSDQIFVFARSHARFDDTPMMSELIDDINAKNNYILMHRIHYDNWVKALNAFKANNREKLISADPSTEVESMPLFELPA